MNDKIPGAKSDPILEKDLEELSEREKLARIIELGFDGDRSLFERFCEKLRRELPAGTGVALRGSVLTNERYEDGRPFDAKGERTSDLDVTLIGEEARAMWRDDAYYIPGLHTKPLGDKDPKIAPADFIMYVRDVLLGQPYFMIIEAEETEE
jgi:hypothetical protein